MELFNFLFQVSICLTVLYLLYHFAFRKLTFFSFNRLYLLVSIAISLVLSSISIEIAMELPEFAAAIPTALTGGAEQKEEFAAIGTIKEKISWLLYAQYLYAFISLCLLVKLFRSIALILYKAKRQGKKVGNYYHVKDETAEGYSSFFNIIFLDRTDKDEQQIIAHEQVHSRLLHSADHLFAEIAGAILWFNPIIYFVKRSLYQIHEFEVDRHLTQYYEVKPYAELLLNLATTNKLILKNGFSTIGVKGRIEMLFRNRSPRPSRLLYLLIIPVLCGLTYSFTIEKKAASHTLPKGFVVIIDPAHGGKDAGGISRTRVQEKDITLQMATILQSLAFKKGISTVLTRSKDVNVTLQERLQVKGSIVISLHMKAGTTEKDVTGFEVGYFAGNAQSSNSQKLAEITQKQLSTISEMYTSKNFLNANPLILRENLAPGILIEMGDANYKPDIQYMLDKRKQVELAAQILKAVQSYHQ